MATIHDHRAWNLVPTLLDRLLGEGVQIGSPLLKKKDFRDVYGFVIRLKGGADSLSNFLWNQLSPALSATLTEWQENESLSPAVVEELLQELNDVLQHQTVFQSQRFAHIPLSKKIRRILDEPTPDLGLVWVNRWLLEEAYREIHTQHWEYAHSYHLEKLLQHVSRDLSDLLNTRWEWPAILPERYQRISESLLKYGLPDITAFSLQNDDDCLTIVEEVKNAIQIFEPRLQGAEVSLRKDDDMVHTLHLRISGLLRVKPIPQPVIFDAVLQHTEYDQPSQSSNQPIGTFVVQGQTHA